MNCFGQKRNKIKMAINNIFLMADYLTGYEITKYLKQKKENIVGLAIHPSRMENIINKGYTEKIIKAVDLPYNKIFSGEEIKKGEHLDRIKKLDLDLILCIMWGFILQPELIRIPKKGCINLHLAYLPYNRGKNPNVWPIIEGTPAGVTLHYIDEKIDTGNIISRSEVEVESIDTGKTLYNKLIDESINLFKKTWPDIKKGTEKRIKQDDIKATLHYGRDLKKLDEIDLDKEYNAKELINLIRARTFAPFPPVYFIDNNGKKVYVRVQLEYAKENNWKKK